MKDPFFIKTKGGEVVEQVAKGKSTAKKTGKTLT
jgi:hypothetical protein